MHFKVIVNDTVLNMKKTPYIGVGIDESTDRSSEKHVVFTVRYQHGDNIKTTYLKMKTIEDGKAQTVYNTLCDVFKEYGISTSKVNINMNL